MQLNKKMCQAQNSPHFKFFLLSIKKERRLSLSSSLFSYRSNFAIQIYIEGVHSRRKGIALLSALTLNLHVNLNGLTILDKASQKPARLLNRYLKDGRHISSSLRLFSQNFISNLPKEREILLSLLRQSVAPLLVGRIHLLQLLRCKQLNLLINLAIHNCSVELSLSHLIHN